MQIARGGEKGEQCVLYECQEDDGLECDEFGQRFAVRDLFLHRAIEAYCRYQGNCGGNCSEYCDLHVLER